MSEEKKIDPFPSDWKFKAFENFDGLRQLRTYSKFYSFLPDLIDEVFNTGLKEPLSVNSHIFWSMEGTIDSICDTLKKGRLGDAYALLRKFYDSIIMNVYIILYIEDHLSESKVVEKINNWVEGKAQLPKYEQMLTYVEESSRFKNLNKIINSDTRYKKIRDRCNDSTHNNFFKNIYLNDSLMYVKTWEKWYQLFVNDTTNLFILHFSYLFFIKDHWMASTDYVDCLECGLTPEDNSQYWVASFIQEIFDDVIKKYRMDLAKEIVNHTCMHLKF